MTAAKVQPMRRRAVLATCPRCHRPILAGYADDAFLTRLDPTPVTRDAELLAFLAGSRTYALDAGELIRRDRWRIRRPARAAFLEHDCDTPIRPEHLAPVPPLPGHLLPDADVEPPF